MKQIITIIGLFCLILQPIAAQNDSTKLLSEAKRNLKVIETYKSIALADSQKNRLRAAYLVYQKNMDSIATNFSNAKQASKSRLKLDKTWHSTLMNTLTDQQRLRYLTIKAIPTVLAKEATQIELLRRSGLYSDHEMKLNEQKIYKYLMKEQVINLRDQYDVAKRRENIAWLRRQRPAPVKVCDLLEELQAKGKLKDGKIKW